MTLTPTERQSISNKQVEYQDFLRKSVLLTYMIMNINKVNQIKVTLTVLLKFIQDTKNLEGKHGANYGRIKDYDTLANEIF